MSRVASLLVALAVLAGCSAPERPPAPVDAQLAPPHVYTAATIFGGPSNVADVQTATEIEAVRLSGSEFITGQGLFSDWSEPQTKGAPPDFGPRYREAEVTVVAVTTEDATALRSLLTAPETYGSNGVFCACTFVPSVLIRFWIGEEPIDVLIAFNCATLAVFRAGRRLADVTRFDGGFEVLLEVVRRVFPDDEALRLAAERR